MGASAKWLKAFLSTTWLSKKSLSFEEEELERTTNERWRKRRVWRSPATPRNGDGRRALQREGKVDAVGELAREEAEDQAVGNDGDDEREKKYGDAQADASLQQSMELEKKAALKIQAAFRGFLSRRALKALRSLVRLQALVRGHQVRRQAAMTLRCMQVLLRVQARVRARRAYTAAQNKVNEHRMLLPEAQIAQSHHLRASVQASTRSFCPFLRPQKAGWCDSHYTLNELQAKLQQKQDGAIKRGREMAYALSYQCRSRDVRSYTLTSDDEPHREWRSVEAARPWHMPLNEEQQQQKTPKIFESDAQYRRSWERTQRVIRSNTGMRIAPAIYKLNLGEMGSPLSSNSKGTSTTTATSNNKDQTSLPSYMAATASAKAKCHTKSS